MMSIVLALKLLAVSLAIQARDADLSSPSNADRYLPLIWADDGIYMAEAEIHGQTGRFIIDTGAGLTMIEPGFAALAAIDAGPRRKMFHGLTQAELLPTQDVVVTTPLNGNRQLSVGLLDEPLPYPSAANGLLGLDAIMPENAALEIDFPGTFARIHDAEDAPEPRLRNAWVDIQYSDRQPGMMLIPIKMDGIKGLALIDTGVPFIVMNPAYAEAMERRGLRAKRRITGYSEEEETPEVLLVRKIAFGALGLRNAPVYVLDAPAFDALGLRDTPALILGAIAFEDLKLVIDMNNDRIAAAPPEYFDERSPCTGSRLGCPHEVNRIGLAH